MSYTYTTDELITDVQGRGMLASSSSTLASADYLRFINDELQTYIVPFLMGVREEFFVTSSDVTGTTTHAIPTRAIGAKLRNVLYLSGSDYLPLERLEPERVARSGTTTGAPAGYYLEGNNVVLYPTPTTTTTVRMSYFIRPNRCVLLADTRIVSSTTPTTIVMGSTPPSTFTSSGTYDVIKGTPHFESRAIDQATSNLTSATLTFSSVSTSIVAGDYVALKGETPIPQIPVELHPLLAERVVVRALQALGDPKVEIALASAASMRKGLETLLTPRSEGSSRYVINFNAPGWGRRNRYR